MARMPTYEQIRADFEAEANRIAGYIDQHIPHHASAAQAAAVTKENRMSLAADLHALELRVGHLTDDVIGGVETITAHPETATLITDLSALIGINPPRGVITAGLAGIRALLAAYAPPAQQ